MAKLLMLVEEEKRAVQWGWHTTETTFHPTSALFL